MRQLGTLATESDARRLAAYLITQRIDAEAEQDGASWVLWVRDEDKLAAARDAFTHYQANPNEARYQGAERTADNLRREEEQRRRSAQKNIVEMRGNWGSGTAVARRCPLVIALIAAAVLVALFTKVGAMPATMSPLRELLFVDPILFFSAPHAGNMFASIARGEVWRLVSPIFLHFGWMHLVFNLYWLYLLGGQIENRRGTWRFAALVLGIAVVSNAAQALASDHFFGGLSGVGYGLFGYMWMKVRFDNSSGYQLHPQTIFLMMLWFFLCIAAVVPPFDAVLGKQLGNVANVVHAAGLIFGIAVGYAPVLWKRAP